ncbi:MAG: FAD-dependent oxidoreductase [Chitinophagales bacterium]
MKQTDYIIVGQGIAGSMVAYYLLKKGKSVVVVDLYNPNSSSNIAAGVVNPITGRKMVKTWKIDEILPFSKNAYKELEQELGVSFLFEKEIFKVFSSQEDVNIWNIKKTDAEYMPYLGDIVYPGDNNPHISAPFGAGVIQLACWMDVPVFTKAFRTYLLKEDRLLEEEFDFSALEMDDTVSYKDISASGIIFCEGYRAFQNPYFKWIPFALAKGEQIEIHAEDLKLSDILNRNIFIIPKGNDLYSIGSTFVWDDVEESITDAGRAEILQKMEKVVKSPYTIVEERAGIRPAMPDRRPVIGRHPAYRNMFIFNGMGTKGVSLSPYLADFFTDYLEHYPEISHEISINRFED